MNACEALALVRLHFAGELAPSDERRMREHLPVCAACRDLYRRHLVLAQFDASVPTAEQRIAWGLGLRTRRRTLAAPLAAICAAAALVVLALRFGAGDRSFASRGPISRPTAAPTSRIFVYDVRAGSRPALVSGSVRLGDELAFAYQNGTGKRRLAIFGVDEHGHVYWFHPAWTSEGDTPVAVAIEADDHRHELPEAIRHAFDGTRLEIRSIFLDEAMSVRRFEELLRAAPPGGALGIPGAIEASLPVEVMP